MKPKYHPSYQYKGTKNNRLEDVTHLEVDNEKNNDFKNVNENEEGVKEEEIIPIILTITAYTTRI